MRTFNTNKIVKIHLFNQIWRVGGHKIVNGKLHSIIYGPDDKEYHVWGNDVKSFYHDVSLYGWRKGLYTKADPLKVKMYILTQILDNKENWTFDMKQTPKPGLVKVIFETGKIAWVEFKEKWEDSFEKIETSYPTSLNPEWEFYRHKIRKNGEEEPSQYLWEPTIEYRKIVAWKIK